MLVFSRGGILVPVLGLAVLAWVEYATEAIFDDADYFQDHGWPKLVGCLLLAEVYWVVGRYLNRNAEKRFVDLETGKEVVVSHEHSFFHIPVEYWAFVALVFGVVALFL